MKKIIVFMGFILLANFADEAAAAQCGTGTNRVNGNAITTLLNGRFVCATRGSDTWRECHGTLSGTSCAPGGALWDLKLGTDPVDPAENVGTWSRSGNTVIYNYVSDGAYSYEIWQIGTTSTYDFCGISPSGNNVLIATIQSGACP